MECDKKYCGKGSMIESYELPFANATLDINIKKMQSPRNKNVQNNIRNNPSMIKSRNEPRSKFTNKNTLQPTKLYNVNSNATRRRPQINNRSESNEFTSPPPEIFKIKLILTLKKLKEEGIKYSLISQYFSSEFNKLKRTDKASEVWEMEEIFIFDRNSVQNSDFCYNTVLSNVQDSKYTNYSLIKNVINSLSLILKELK